MRMDGVAIHDLMGQVLVYIKRDEMRREADGDQLYKNNLN